MPTLNLYKSRQHLTVTLANGKTYKIPKEYTVEEVERLLELKREEKKLSNTPVSDDADESDEKLELFWNNIFNQLEVIFQSLEPDIDIAHLKKNVTHKEALEIVGFFNEYRTTAQNTDQSSQMVDTKKKLKI